MDLKPMRLACSKVIINLGDGGDSHCWGTYGSAIPLEYLLTPASVSIGAFFVQFGIFMGH